MSDFLKNIVRRQIYKYLFLCLLIFPIKYGNAGGLHENLEANYFQDSLNYNAIEYFIEAKTAEIQGDFTTAITLYRKALEFDDSPGIHFAISLTYYKIGKLREALAEINKAIVKGGEKTDYLIHKANVYLQFNDLPAAIRIYETILKNEPENISIQYTLARLYEEQNNKQKALELYELITDQYGFDINVLNRLYDIYLNSQNFKDAARILEYILKLDPFDMSNNIKLAALYRIIGQYQKSLSIYENLFKINPKDKNIQTELVKLYFLNNQVEKGFNLLAETTGKAKLTYSDKIQVGEIYYNLISQEKEYLFISKNIFRYLIDFYYYDTTVSYNWKPYYYLGNIAIAEKDSSYFQYFDSAIRILEKDEDKKPEPYSLIGLSYYSENQYTKAKEIVQKGLELFSDDYRLNFLYGLILQREGNNENAIKYFEIAVEKEPNDISLLSTLALAYNTAGRYKESEEMYERALKINPDDPLVLNNYAYNLAVRGEKLDKALEMAKKAVSKDPKNPNFLDTIGWIYYKLKEYDLALDFILKSIAINAGSAVVQEHLGDVYYALKDKTNALKHWKIALELNPQNRNLEEKINSIK
ncbi:MAG: tetratricopeptide repeat protein [Ignavibacteria bacterium]|nr:tetratricopeptide repeat protein [Ignavibacteria bacterium]